jgi:formylglycine-generating enzyme required for sulfatase activity
MVDEKALEIKKPEDIIRYQPEAEKLIQRGLEELQRRLFERFVIRFRGVRGSYPVLGETTSRVGGNTACVEVWAGGHLIIIDAGTGIIDLGKDLMRKYRASGEKEPIVATMLFSHTHYSHIQGFPFFTPAYEDTSVLYMFGPTNFHEDIEEALRRAMLAPTFPVALREIRSLKVMDNIKESQVVILDQGKVPQILNVYPDKKEDSLDAVEIGMLRSYAHPQGGVSLYKISWAGKSMVYASDTESYVGGDTRLIEFARGTDLLIHDAQYTNEEYVTGPKQGWGHSTPEMAIAIAQAAKVKKLVLFHHDPAHDDDTLAEMEKRAQGVFPNTILAYEGLTIELHGTIPEAVYPIVREPSQPFEPGMILIPAGEFLMGSDPSIDKYARAHEHAQDRELPQHTLYLPDYYLSKTPVTNAQYAVFVQATGHRQPEHWAGGKPLRGKEDHPVVNVSWYDAVAYCRWLSEITGKPYCLPSEAEWEKGARGSDGRIYPWGNQWDAERCNSKETHKRDTKPVEAYPQGASPYGLLDMAGNVWEWTRSLFLVGDDPFEYPYDPGDGREVLELKGRQRLFAYRVLRGGAFYLDKRHVRCAFRLGYYPGHRLGYVGFRVAVALGYPLDYEDANHV